MTITVDLKNIFRAGFVRRWHTNPELSGTCDRIDGHSARVARIIIALHPSPSVGLIKEALTHDDGESVVGDLKAPTKDEHPVIAGALGEMEVRARVRIWGLWAMESLSPDDSAWLKFADRLDAFMWASHHAPQVMGEDGWPEAKVWISHTASKLGVRDEVRSVLGSISVDAGKPYGAKPVNQE